MTESGLLLALFFLRYKTMKINNLLVLIMTPFICFAAGYFLSSIYFGANKQATPNIVGLTLQQALELTAKHRLNIQLVNQKETSDIAPGIILSQKPSAGRYIKPNQTILITISKKLAVSKTPALIGKSLKDIQSISKKENITLKTYTIDSPTEVTSTCIGQFPHQNSDLPQKKIVAYIAKSPTNMYIMPNFCQQKLTDVLHALAPYQIAVCIIYNNQILQPPFEQNFVIIEQKPKAGSFIKANNNTTIQFAVETQQDQTPKFF